VRTVAPRSRKSVAEQENLLSHVLSLDEGHEHAALDEAAYLGEIRSEGSIALPERGLGPDQLQRVLQFRRGLERRAQLHPLRRGQQLDGDDRRRVGRHRRETKRRVGGHADVIFLVGRRRQRIDAARCCQRLVL
jgi:hypothetical protein